MWTHIFWSWPGSTKYNLCAILSTFPFRIRDFLPSGRLPKLCHYSKVKVATLILKVTGQLQYYQSLAKYWGGQYSIKFWIIWMQMSCWIQATMPTGLCTPLLQQWYKCMILHHVMILLAAGWGGGGWGSTKLTNTFLGTLFILEVGA